MWLRDPQHARLSPSGDPCSGTGLPAAPAVYLILANGQPVHMGQTSSLKRRLARLFRPGSLARQLLQVETADLEVRYWRVASRLEAHLGVLEVARTYFPADYQHRIRLRLPAYVKLMLAIRYPRTQVTRRLRGARAVYFGPFRSRPAAEKFESEFLNFFQLRRCEENLQPSPEHPGCIYGEMNRCLRPCQAVVTEDEYAREVERVERFLRSRGQSLLQQLEAARNQASQALNFEEAAYHHRRYERLVELLRSCEEIATDIDRLYGVAVTPSLTPEAVELWFVHEGFWLAPRAFRLIPESGRPLPLELRLRELIATLEPPTGSLAEKEEHLAVLASWYFSSSRDGEWLAWDDPAHVPYRRLVNAIRRVLDHAAGRTDRQAGSTTVSGSLFPAQPPLSGRTEGSFE